MTSQKLSTLIGFVLYRKLKATVAKIFQFNAIIISKRNIVLRALATY